jgi:hypothetical protein
MKSLRFVCTVSVASVVGCSVLPGGGSSAPRPTAYALATDTEVVAPPNVQVRAFSHSAVVSVVAWDANDPEFGIRTSVNRSGVLVGGVRFGDHRLYMTPLLARELGGFVHAAVMPGQLLLQTGALRDTYACFYGTECSPMTTIGVRIPDTLLRTHRDSLVVTFFPRVQSPWTLELRRELIAAYLQKVDSVVAEMRKPRTT